MSEKKELKEDDIEKVSGGWMKDTDDDSEEGESIISITDENNCPRENIISRSNARPNR